SAAEPSAAGFSGDPSADQSIFFAQSRAARAQVLQSMGRRALAILGADGAAGFAMRFSIGARGLARSSAPIAPTSKHEATKVDACQGLRPRGFELGPRPRGGPAATSKSASSTRGDTAESRDLPAAIASRTDATGPGP